MKSTKLSKQQNSRESILISLVFAGLVTLCGIAYFVIYNTDARLDWYKYMYEEWGKLLDLIVSKL